MSLFENIDKLITERGSAAILRERLALAEDKFAALEVKANALAKKVADLESENSRLQAKLESLQPVGPKGDRCPYCQQEKGVLKSLDPHPQSLLRKTGHKIARYECAGCEKTYDRQVRH